MNFLHAIILGIIEGLTEFLPISSTGHLMIGSNILNIPLNPFVTSFNIYIQLGAILAVVVLYLKKLLIKYNNVKLVISAFIPTIIIGLLIYPFVKKVLLTNLLVVAIALIIGGIGLIIFEYYFKHKKNTNQDLTLKNSFVVGVCQMLAAIPGVSRSAATIVGGMLMGIKREKIVEFSFFLAIPTMIAASSLDILESGWNFSTNEWQLILVGFITAFVTAILAIKWFINYIQKHTFTAFGIYRIIIGLIILLLILKP